MKYYVALMRLLVQIRKINREDDISLNYLLFTVSVILFGCPGPSTIERLFIVGKILTVSTVPPPCSEHLITRYKSRMNKLCLRQCVALAPDFGVTFDAGSENRIFSSWINREVEKHMRCFGGWRISPVDVDVGSGKWFWGRLNYGNFIPEMICDMHLSYIEVERFQHSISQKLK